MISQLQMLENQTIFFLALVHPLSPVLYYKHQVVQHILNYVILSQKTEDFPGILRPYKYKEKGAVRHGCYSYYK